jgi:hypothetical protein
MKAAIGTASLDQYAVRKAIRELESAVEEINMPPADEITRYRRLMRCRRDVIALLCEVQLREFDRCRQRDISPSPAPAERFVDVARLQRADF